MKLPKGTLAVTLFFALPLAIWCLYAPPELSVFYAGKILGVFGFIAFTLALLLAIRVPAQEKIFGDLGQSYWFHQMIGTVALIALLLHPVLLAWQYIQLSMKDAAVFLLPIGNLPKTIGIIGGLIRKS